MRQTHFRHRILQQPALVRSILEDTRSKPASTSIKTTITGLLVAALMMLSGCSNQPSERAILLSIDAMNESILRQYLTEDEAPALYRVFDHGACADFAVPAFPSVTSAGHASLWTGTYGNRSNVTANSQHVLPRDQYTVMEMQSGYSHERLSAEPIWITLGKLGLPVAAHHTTQSPYTPGYFPVSGQRDETLNRARTESEEVLQKDHVMVFNGYNKRLQYDAVLTARNVEWVDASAWQNVGSLWAEPAPKAFQLELEAGPVLYGLVTGDALPERAESGSAESGSTESESTGSGETQPVASKSQYTTIWIGTRPDLKTAVRVTEQPAEQTSPAGRELARYFSEPIRLETQDGPVFTRFRLFDLRDDGTQFMLYHPAIHIVESNNDPVLERYRETVQGWFGNSSTFAYRRGSFGPTLMNGGDGTAEDRYLETAELLTRVHQAGAEFLWREGDPVLMADYFPLSDSIDHTLLGYLDPRQPDYDAELAEKVIAFRARVWQLVDLRLQHLLDLADEADATLFLSGDHGMRATWMQHYPNNILRDAGLLVTDENGEIDLSKTVALSPNGYWISLNRTAWQEGIVTPEQEQDVIERVIEAMSSATGADGQPLYEDLLIAAEHPELGIGGPAGGDVYWKEQFGYRGNRFLTDDGAFSRASLGAGHGFDSREPDMHTAFCAYGNDFSAGRIPGVRTIDVVPTIADYLGVSAPANHTGTTVLAPLMEALPATNPPINP